MSRKPTVTARRRPGEGSYFYVASKGLHTYRLDLGVDPRTGKRAYKEVASKDQARALAKFNELRDQRRTFGTVTRNVPTVEKYLNRWVSELKLKPTTLRSYSGMIRLYLVPILGKKKLDALTPRDIKHLHRTMDAQGCSVHNVLGAHRVLSAALSDAVSDELVMRNVAAVVDRPSLKGTSKRHAMSTADVGVFLLANAEDRLIARYLTAFLTGERQGECLGLEWDRVTLDPETGEGTADVSWQLQRLYYRHGCADAPVAGDKYPCGKKRAGSCPKAELDVPEDFEYRQLHGGLCLTRPKSDASTRLVPLHPALVRALLVRREGQVAGEPNPHNLVFTTPEGAPIDPSKDNAAWHAALTRAKLPSIPLHNARHTAITHLRGAKADRDTIKDLVGHSTIATASTYLDRDMDAMREAILDLGKRLQIEG